MAQGILVFIEERDGAVKKPSLEALGAARKLADVLQETVTALVIGNRGNQGESCTLRRG